METPDFNAAGHMNAKLEGRYKHSYDIGDYLDNLRTSYVLSFLDRRVRLLSAPIAIQVTHRRKSLLIVPGSPTIWSKAA
jgi:hypothetical protein